MFVKSLLSKKGIIICLAVIFFLGTFLRFYKLGQVPSSLNWDEVSWGYNAYSILETGKDEYGRALPLSFEAFGDFKQPVYVYLQVPVIKVLGLNAFAVRFPSALLGSISILFVFLLVYELFQQLKYKSQIALITAFFFAVSPWSIQFSRVAFEANVGLFFILVGAWMFVKGLNNHKIWYLFLACIPLGISAHTYHSEKLFSPLFFGGLVLLGYSYFMKHKKTALILMVFFVLCNSLWLFDPRTTKRGRSVTFTSQQTQILGPSLEKIRQDEASGDTIGSLSHNRRFVYALKYADNYLKHFDLNYLFVKGDNARHHAPGMGVLYLVNLLFIIYGIITVIRRKVVRIWFVFFWLLLAPTASALAVDAPNASRSLIILPTWDIFAAFGWYYLFQRITSVRFSNVMKIGLILLMAGNIFYYINQYFTLTNYEYSEYWQDGYRQAVQATAHSDKPVFYMPDIEQGYIFYLFYTQYDPQKYIQEGGSARIKKSCFQIDKEYFGACSTKIQPGDFVITSKVDDSLNTSQKIKTITYPNGLDAVTIYKK